MRIGFKPLIVTLILGSPLLLTGCETLGGTDPDLFGTANSSTQRDRSTGQRTLYFENRSSQIKKGNQYAERFIATARQQGRKINQDAGREAYARIKRIFNRLHRVSHLGHERWTPVLIEAPNWNAFTTGGSYFVIFSALERYLTDDDELAYIMAREMAHTVANHDFTQQKKLNAKALDGADSAQPNRFQSAFANESEMEAEEIGILYCALAGFDPYAGAAIWQRLYRQRQDSGLFIQDQPLIAQRADNARRTADHVREYYSPGRENPSFRRLLAHNDLFQTDYSESIHSSYPYGGGMAMFEPAANLQDQIQPVNQEEANEAQRIALMKSIQDATQIVRSEPIAPNRWRFVLDYRGDRQLTDLDFKAIIHVEPKAVQMFRQMDGILRPNTRFEVIFESDEYVNAYTTRPEQVQFIFDGATAK